MVKVDQRLLAAAMAALRAAQIILAEATMLASRPHPAWSELRCAPGV